MTFQPSFHDIAHVGHVELLTPCLDKSVEFFTTVLGLFEAGRKNESVYLRAWGDYETYTLKLTSAKTSGLGHVGLRTRSDDVLQSLSASLQGEWVDDEFGHGPAYRFKGPDTHTFEIYYQTQKFASTTSDSARPYKNQPQRRNPNGIGPRRLDHINLLAADFKATRLFLHEKLGMRITEQIILDDGTEAGAWLSATNKSYDIAVTRDNHGAKGRFHHATYFVDSREEILRAADLLVEAGVSIETGPHKHNIGQTFFLYFLEPGGNRIELGFGGYLILDPDWQPVIWTQADRAKGQAWGLQTVSSFHTYGTPPVPGTEH